VSTFTRDKNMAHIEIRPFSTLSYTSSAILIMGFSPKYISSTHAFILVHMHMGRMARQDSVALLTAHSYVGHY